MTSEKSHCEVVVSLAKQSQSQIASGAPPPRNDPQKSHCEVRVSFSKQSPPWGSPPLCSLRRTGRGVARNDRKRVQAENRPL